MRLSVTSRRPGGVGQPPASLRGTMERGSTGQTRSGNPPPACGAACARVRRSRFGVWPHGKARSAQPVGSECVFPSRRDRRMRLSVRVPAQNALFRRVRLSSPGQTWRHLTEKRILSPASHGKARSAVPRSRGLRLSVTSRRPGGVGQPPRQAAGHYGKRPNWANALVQPPASLRGGLRQVAETGTAAPATAPNCRTPLHARSNRASSFKLPLREFGLRWGKRLFP